MKKITYIFDRLGKKTAVVSSAVGVSLASAGASAAIDTTDALAEVALATTAITTVGSALIVLAAVVLGIRWVKAMFF